MKKYDYAIVIGRFQPLHLAHQDLIRYSLSLAEKVIVILGSARSAPDVRNPFTPAVREEIIRACFPEDEKRLIFRAVRDYPYNDHVWTAEVQNVVGEITEEDDGKENASVAIVGFFKDRTSYYLNLFPQWNFEEFYCADKRNLSVNATEIREKFFAEDEEWQNLVPETVAKYLNAFRATQTRFCVVSFTSDWLYPTRESRRIVQALNAVAANVSFVEIESDKGHDAFLLNEPTFHATVRGFLNAAALKRGLDAGPENRA